MARNLRYIITKINIIQDEFNNRLYEPIDEFNYNVDIRIRILNDGDEQKIKNLLVKRELAKCFHDDLRSLLRMSITILSDILRKTTEDSINNEVEYDIKDVIDKVEGQVGGVFDLQFGMFKLTL